MTRLGLLSLVVKIFGAGGFVGLLVASHYLPAAATPLRAVALLWFLSLGVIFALIPSSEAKRSNPWRPPWR